MIGSFNLDQINDWIINPMFTQLCAIPRCLTQACCLSVYLHTYIPATYALSLATGNTGCAQKTERQMLL